MWKHSRTALRRRVRGFSALVLATALVAAGCARAPADDPPSDAVIRLSDQFSSDFSLIDMNGHPLSSADLRGRILVIYFGYTNCPDVCPLALSKLSAALNLLKDNQLREIAPLFITVDPQRDDPPTLKSYLAFDKRIIGLTGEQAAVDHARQSFKVYASKKPHVHSAHEYGVNHSSLFYFVDRAGRVRLAVHDSIKPSELAVMLRRSIKW